ncbi:hypothetical protein [Vibrio neptunius]|uniref:Uncharacterized protein n=1 Tax=Vibrio neptunius TaxID=170651 RepID=A0ABS3A1V6_9VIBR|nr:hypothetical protein [Vibrio neptunius]MBN3493582.1 hypothetical protein [Vibrio neptunius]MBN3516188.1 hypothetical protein [Vibrio neptunius]MBN3550349.1 hypothetical protein [Vibrio neptunius]MBN3578383.1 hypothetical protein [Vibrio neptunius]MCH9872047.1 hypothetical protein [Vibrio neptunius]
MIDPNRIAELLELVKEIWLRDPDLRFNQLIYNLQLGYSQQHGGIGQITEVEEDGFSRTGFDLFNLDDDSFIEYLKSIALNQQSK